ncbi:MAG: thymidylate synthase [Bacteroidetes bacterium]|nr:thymidylate synthase [Bacteroidota bacterium]
MNLMHIDARDIPDAWFQCLYQILEKGNKYKIDRGSYKGQERLEFDYATIHIKHPNSRPLIPDIPQGCDVPAPVLEEYVDGYLPYLITSEKKEGEIYTYGEYLEPQIAEVIDMLKTDGEGTNQAYMTIGDMNSIKLEDPPCLRGIDCRLRDNKLNFVLYFRSWDLWNGLPANLAAIQLMKEYMADMLGAEDGEIIASSKGLHLYDYAWSLAEIRTMKG